MNEQQAALAYARAYSLFSRIYRHGLDDESAQLLNIDGGDGASHYGAAHYQLFVHNVFPYETIFLGDDGLLGGTITEGVAAFYQRIGFAPQTDESADHISSEFDAMAFLCLAESDAAEDDIPHQVQRLRQLQRRFLDEHMLRWLPAFCIAVQQQEPNLYTEIVQQSFDLVCTHREHLGDDLMAANEVFSLPPVPGLLTDEKTSLRDIARYLLTPAHVGFYLSSDDIKRTGAAFRLPHGFGKRQQILLNLLRTASDYDLFRDVVLAFRQRAIDWQAQFDGMAAAPAAVKTVWQERLQNSIAVLDEIERLAQDQIIMTDDIADETEMDRIVAQGESGAGCATGEDAINDTTC